MVCWQYQKRMEFLAQDLKELGIGTETINRLRVRDFTFGFADRSEYPAIKDFILRYEWLGTMPKRISHRYVCRYQGKLAGVLLFTTPNNPIRPLTDSAVNLERLLARGACISWAPKNLASGMIARALRAMVETSPYRVFTAYADPEAGEIGTIYQALGWTYLGGNHGATALYRHPNETFWFSPRRQTNFAAWRRRATALGVEWNSEWNTRTTVHWDKVPLELRDALKKYRDYEKEFLLVRKISRKHKYIKILSPCEEETKRLTLDFKLPSTTIPYPKRPKVSELL